MTAIFTYPLLALGLVVMWLLLAGFTLGQFVVAIGVAILATEGLKALGESSPRIRRWLAIPELAGLVFRDVLWSNIAVTRITLSQKATKGHSGFLTIPVRLRNPSGLAVLAIVLTSTPGTAWLDYNSTQGAIIIHVLDLDDAETLLDLIANRYERLLMEIFE